LNFTENKFDILIIGYFLSTSLVGIYSISIAISVIFQTIVQTSISTILFPVLIKTEIDKRGLLTQKYFKLSYVLAFLFFVALLLFGEFFIITVYGDEFQGAYIPVIVLAIGALVKSPAACINSFFKASGKPEELYKTSVYTVIVNIVLCIWLIPLYGIIGAAIASSISYFLYGFIMIFKFIKFTDTRLLNLIIIGKQDVDYIKRTIINRGE
jgi:O-antigen/teichoic acid export membrane protein